MRSFIRDIARVCTCETRDSEMPSVRPISRALTPSRASRSICRICRMVSSLLAGIRFPSLINEGLDA